MRHPLTLAIFALLASAPVLTAQQYEILPGTRVRVVAPGRFPGRVEGHLIEPYSADAGTLVIATSGGSVRVLSASVARLELYQGRSRARGALRGFLVGAPLGIAFALATKNDRNQGAHSSGDSISVNAYAAGGVVVFGGIGALIGGAIGVERWIPLAGPSRVSVVPLRRGVRAGLVYAVR